MFIVNLQLNLFLPYAHSLKGRRKIVHSLKERLSRHNLSILDLSGEYVKEADIAIAFLALNSKAISQKIHTIEDIIQKHFSEIEYSIDYEIL